MKKKIVNVVLFLAVLAAALGMTFYVGNNAMSVLLYNFVFLGIIAVVYVVGLFGGMFRMNRLAQSLGDAAQELEDMFKMPGRVAPDKIESMNGIFHNHYLDARMKAFTDGIAKSQEGIVDIGNTMAVFTCIFVLFFQSFYLIYSIGIFIKLSQCIPSVFRLNL